MTAKYFCLSCSREAEADAEEVEDEEDEADEADEADEPDRSVKADEELERNKDDNLFRPNIPPAHRSRK